MSTGERIRFFRRREKMTQEELGHKMGFMSQSANIRIAQYEWNRRTPKRDILEQLAEIFDIVPEALQNPDINSNVGLMHTLFTLEDTYGLTVTTLDGEICLKQDVNNPGYSQSLADDLAIWNEIKTKLNSGRIFKEEYDHWRYNYPNDKELLSDNKGPSSSSGSSKVAEEPMLYTEDDVLEILRMYKERK